MSSKPLRDALSRQVFALLAVTCCIRVGWAEDRPTNVEDVVTRNNVRYRDGSSAAWTFDLAMPPNSTGKPRPAIVVIHGGGWIEGDKSSFSQAEKLPPGNIRDFAAQGFVAVTVNYRLSAEAPFPAAVHDCKNVVRYLRAHAADYAIDLERIGVWGNSAGGHLALMLAMTEDVLELEGDGPYRDQSSRVQAVCSDSGPIDLLHQHEHNQIRTVIERFLKGPPTDDRLADYRKASPFTFVSSKLPPMLLIYGVDDEQVGVETADRFVTLLQRSQQRDITYLRLGKVGHCPYSLKGITSVPPIVNEFFRRTLN